MSRLVGATALALLSSLAACVDSPDDNGFTNRPPVPVDDYATTTRDTSVRIAVLDNDRDPNGHPLHVTWVNSNGLHNISVDLYAVTITPALGFVGTIEATYGVSDGFTERTGRITVTVFDGSGPQPDAGVWPPDGGAADASTNQAPTTEYIVSQEVGRNGRLPITLNGSDPDGDAITYTITDYPDYGTLTGEPPNVTYIPSTGHSGSDWFEYTVSDGSLTSYPRHVGIYVRYASDVPVALPSMVDVREDSSASFTLQATDTGSTDHRFVVSRQPLRGSVTLSGSRATYTPSARFSGTDSFTFHITDRNGFNATAAATVTLAVESVDDIPVADSQTVRLSEDSSAAVTLTASDEEGQPITFTITSQPSHGRLTGTAPDLVYTPEPNFAGSDAFTFIATAGGSASLPATVQLQVTAVNDPPIAVATRASTLEDTLVAIPLTATDIDTASLTYAIVGAPTMGTATLAANVVTYTPSQNRSGADQLTFEVFDGNSRSRAVVDVEVTAVNDRPIAADDIAVTEPGQRVIIAAAGNDTDVDSAAFAVSEVAAPSHGAAEVTDDGEIAYTPADGFTGTDRFTYTLTDADGGTDTATVHVGVGQFPVDAPPLWIASVGTVTPGRGVSLSADGRLVVFASTARLVATDTNDLSDVYLYDRGTSVMTRISAAAGGGNPDGEASAPRISASGGRIVYESTATNLVAGDSNRAGDVFVYDRASGETRLVSVDTDERPANGASFEPTISDDGNLVAFLSRAFNLAPGDGNGEVDVFVRDLTATTTTRVSVSHEGREAELGSSAVAISGDGRVVAFVSSATNLVAGGTAGPQVFVRHLVDRTTECVSVNTAGAQANRVVQSPSLSRDGRFVAFASQATNLAPDTTASQWRSYVRDRQERHTRLGTPADIDALSTSLSADGRYLVVARGNNTTYLRDRFTPTSHPIASGSTMTPTLSADGRYLVYVSVSRAIVVRPNPL